MIMKKGRADMTILLRLRTLGVRCAAVAAVAAGAATASAAPMSADTLQHGSPSSDVLRVFDPDQREYSRRQTTHNRRMLRRWHTPTYRRIAQYRATHGGRARGRR
jgi:hypothetical protein